MNTFKGGELKKDNDRNASSDSLDVNIAELALVSSDGVHQVPSIGATGRPIKVYVIILSWVFREHIHTIFGILHLPDPPDAVDHAVVKPEERVTGRAEEVLLGK